MRVLQVTPAYPPTPGGVERHVEALSAALVARGHSVTVLSLDARTASGPLPGQVEVLRVPGRVVGPFLVARRLRRTVRTLAAEHDVVHVHNYHSPLPLAVLRSRCRRPVVVTTHFHGDGHGTLARLAHLVYRPLVRSALRLAAAVVCVSRAEADHLVATFPERRGRVRVVPNGVRPLDTSQALPAHWREPLVVCVSRLEEYKRVDVLVSALAMVNGPWRCVVVGAGPQRAELEALAAGLGLADRITFAGTVSDAELDALLLRARVCVQPSSREAFGMALLDGVGAGCRAVASDIPAHTEVATLAGGGVRLWPADGGPVALAGAVVRALSDVAPAAAPDLPTWEGAARQLEAVYRSALRGPAGPPADETVEVVLDLRVADGVVPGPPRTPPGREEANRATPE
ncbi:MAG: glycosyltransferase family 4 protein [Actinobacteria bacterium]|nr:glycosyltransferase family 4 protein [Actinomycetota bacterium]